MRFEDERYFRLYSRDTTTWKLLCWQAKAMLGIIGRKLDRAGMLDLGTDGLDGLAAVTEMPLEVIRAALQGTDLGAGLLARGVFSLSPEGVLVMPRYLDAQEAAASPKLRAELYRARVRVRDAALAPVRSRDEVFTKRDADDTKRDETSLELTARHAPSQTVTLSRTVPYRAVPEESYPILPPRLEPVTIRDEPKRSAAPPRTPKPKDDPDESKPPAASKLYAQAYAAGMSNATGEPFPEPRCYSTLIEIARTYGVRDGATIRGAELLVWIAETAEAYRRARRDAAQFEHGFAPAACLRWLAAGRPGLGTTQGSSGGLSVRETGRETRMRGHQPPSLPGDRRWRSADEVPSAAQDPLKEAQNGVSQTTKGANS